MKNKLIYLAVISLSLSVLSAAPSEINYQGVLTDQQGNPVNGVRAMQIKLYDAPTGGNVTYQQNIGNVTVADGIYSFKFGASGNGVASALNGNDHLALIVDSVEQPARTKILAVPYALKAKESEDTQQLLANLTTLTSSHNALSANLTSISAMVQSVAAVQAEFKVISAYGEMNFGNMRPSLSMSRTLTVRNSGVFNLNISGVTYPTGFSGTWSGGAVIPPGQSAELIVTFSPSVVQNYSGNITINSDATSGSGIVAVSGSGAYVDVVTTLARSWTEESFYGPEGVAVDGSGNVYVADTNTNKIRKISPTEVVTTLAGGGGSGWNWSGSEDGAGTAASFNSPKGVAVDSSGNVYVADTGNHKIRKITSAGVVTTIAGTGTQGSTDGTGTAASFNSPKGVAVDSTGNVYVADSGNHKIRKITSAGVVATLAGMGTQGSSDGTGTSASFWGPVGVAIDSGGNIYVAEEFNSKIRKITAAGVVTTLAGSGSFASVNGAGNVASFWFPTGVSVDSSGNVYVADAGSNKIRKITAAGVVSTLAGNPLNGNWSGSEDGAVTAASFDQPKGVAVDSSGNVYVADSGNNRIRKITIGN
jgi:serine/threonine-protein kinase